MKEFKMYDHVKILSSGAKGIIYVKAKDIVKI